MCCPFFSVVNYSLYSHGRFCAYSIMIVSSLVAYGNTFFCTYFSDNALLIINEKSEEAAAVRSQIHNRLFTLVR